MIELKIIGGYFYGKKLFILGINESDKYWLGGFNN